MPPGERLLVLSTATHGAARIEVRDRGSGIAPDALAVMRLVGSA